jgi:hypothetical protein
MKRRAVSLIAVGISWLCHATTVAPFFHQHALLDRLLAVTNSESAARYIALDLLERVAGGTMDAVNAEFETQVGLEITPGRMHEPAFKELDVRIYAMRRIGDVALPEALEYLQNLKKDDFMAERSSQIWETAQIALHQAHVNRIPDELGKTEFLENTLSEHTPAISWAVEELCNRGSYRSLALIRESIRKRNPTRDGEQQIEFCRARMDILARNFDRTRALGSFLSVSEGSNDRDLRAWAINQLYLTKDPKADAELERYLNEIGKLPKDSPQRAALSLTEQMIRVRLDIRRSSHVPEVK